MKRRSNFVLDNAINAYEHTADSALDRCTLDFLKELREYRNLEEQGLLLRLPCKVGDRIFVIQSNRHYEVMEVKRIEIKHRVGFGDFCYYLEPIGHRGGLYRYYEDDFGKTIFLTQEEAEQKLKEMEGEK